MKTPTTVQLLGTSLLFGLAGCALPSVKALAADEPVVGVAAPLPAPTLPARMQQPASQPLLYARDGSVVGQQQPGTLAMTSQAGQSAAGAEVGSRWTLLEQYQSTIEENEGLQLELTALSQALELSQTREAELAQRVDGLSIEFAQAGERMKTLEGQNVELASRLTTAQIRRLQSEKLLLEAKLDWKRVETVINGSPAASASTEPKLPAPQLADVEPRNTQPNQP
jgi:hypothetical protein